MDGLNAEDAAVVPVINGWIEWAKPFIPNALKKFTPLLAIVLGIGYAFTMKPDACDLVSKIVTGVGLGMGAVGMHATVRKSGKGVVEAKKAADAAKKNKKKK